MTNDINSDFEIVRTLGVGGMASVYLARVNGRDVAVKKLHSFLAADPMSVAALADEAQLGACIQHPNVVGVLDYIEGSGESDPPALVMEWVEGIDLAQLFRTVVSSGRLLPLDVVAAIACDLLSGLHAAHESRRADGLALDIVHRDVSPQNILVGFDGVTRVTDFGVAKAAWRTQYTEQGSIKGKLGYLAPEQLEGRCDRRSDIFGAGAVLWELLTGERMRSGDGVEVLVEILYKHVAPPSTHVSDAERFDTIVACALARAPEDRFATAKEMCAAIASVITPASAERVAAVVRMFAELDAPPRATTPPPADDLAQSGERPRIDFSLLAGHGEVRSLNVRRHPSPCSGVSAKSARPFRRSAR